MKPNCILIFGESYNDANAVGHLVGAINPNARNIRPRKTPMVLSRDAEAAKRRKNRNAVLAVVQAEKVKANVIAVIIHRDCDAIEPAHKEHSFGVRRDFDVYEVNVIPAVPAYEIEAWWFLWPTALSAVNSKWSRVRCMTRNHGKIANAKERLIADLRSSNRTNDYTEADSPRVAEMVRRLGIVHQRCGQSESFEDFMREVDAI